MRFKISISIGTSFDDVLDFNLTAPSMDEAFDNFLKENPIYIGYNYLLTKITNLCSEAKITE
jgi:hypothetical protein